MNVNDLKKTVESYRQHLNKKSGTTCIFSESGPASMSLIDAIVSAVEAQERRLATLEKWIGGFKPASV